MTSNPCNLQYNTRAVYWRVHHLVHVIPMVNDLAVLAFVLPRFAARSRLCRALSGVVVRIVVLMVVMMAVVAIMCVFMPMLMRMTYPKTRRT
jgi:hypothetical protein